MMICSYPGYRLSSSDDDIYSFGDYKNTLRLGQKPTVKNMGIFEKVVFIAKIVNLLPYEGGKPRVWPKNILPKSHDFGVL